MVKCPVQSRRWRPGRSSPDVEAMEMKSRFGARFIIAFGALCTRGRSAGHVCGLGNQYSARGHSWKEEEWEGGGDLWESKQRPTMGVGVGTWSTLGQVQTETMFLKTTVIFPGMETRIAQGEQNGVQGLVPICSILGKGRPDKVKEIWAWSEAMHPTVL